MLTQMEDLTRITRCRQALFHGVQLAYYVCVNPDKSEELSWARGEGPWEVRETSNRIRRPLDICPSTDQSKILLC